MSKRIRVLIVDDQSLFREGLKIILSTHKSVEVIGDVANGEQAIEFIELNRVDVVLMDLNMPVLDGVAATHEISKRFSSTKVIILTTFDEDDRIFEALRAGALGYLLKDIDSAKLLQAIESASIGESFLQPSVAAKVVAEFARIQSPPLTSALLEPLSFREKEILQWITHGLSNKEIADKVGLAEGTVKNHISNIFGKMDVLDRTQAALKARDLGIC